MKIFNTKQSGQSLLEMIFAIGILLIVISAILALTSSGIVGQKASELEVTANNLAREGIEVVRNIRDSNWLASSDHAWDDGFSVIDPSQNQAVVKFDSVANTWQLDFSSPDTKKLLYIQNDGLLIHQSGGSSRPSIFSRILTINSICHNTNTTQEVIKPTCDSSEQKVGVKVLSAVTWQERGRNRLVILEDLLYAWK